MGRTKYVRNKPVKWSSLSFPHLVPVSSISGYILRWSTMTTRNLICREKGKFEVEIVFCFLDLRKKKRKKKKGKRKINRAKVDSFLKNLFLHFWEETHHLYSIYYIYIYSIYIRSFPIAHFVDTVYYCSKDVSSPFTYHGTDQLAPFLGSAPPRRNDSSGTASSPINHYRSAHLYLYSIRYFIILYTIYKEPSYNMDHSCFKSLCHFVLYGYSMCSCIIVRVYIYICLFPWPALTVYWRCRRRVPTTRHCHALVQLSPVVIPISVRHPAVYTQHNNKRMGLKNKTAAYIHNR